MINNRQQSGRRRGRGGQRQGGGGNPGRPDGGNRIDNRARGNANQLFEKYKNLAADSVRAGDRVTTEYYLQFADHYYRVLAETRPRFEEQQRQTRMRDDQFDDESDGGDQEEYGDEGDTIRPNEQTLAPQQAGDGRNGGGRGFEERRPRRDEGERQPRYERETRDRNDGERLNGRYRAEPQAADDARAAEPDLPLPEPDAPQQRRRGRPRKVEATQADAPAAFDADRLPPALGVPANDPDETGEPKPRRRRARTVAEAPAVE